MANTRPMAPMYKPRSRSVVMSERMISTMAWMPPPPTPWMPRPMTRTKIDLAQAQRTEPPRKMAIAIMSEFRRPTTSAKPPIAGCVAVTVSRKADVIHVPGIDELGKSLTIVGKAVLMIV